MDRSGRSTPRGTATFLLTDVEGSTRLWEAETATMPDALAWHDETIGRCVAAHAGRLVKSQGEGDSTFSVFARASDAVRAALDLQRALAGIGPATGLHLAVRVALHTGEAEMRDGDYFGLAVNRCARLRAAAHGGQILLSESTVELAGAALPDESSLRDLGVHRLKDLARPERVFQLCHPEISDDFPPLRSLDTRGHNLPALLTRFIGRERELARLTEAVAAHRLVTVTGIGGVGKTRLAVEVAGEAVSRHSGGTWFTALDGVDAGRVAAAVAATLGIREEPGRDMGDTVVDHLAGRDVLLVIDNCEHVLDVTAGLVARVLQAAPDVRVLATSREPLGVPGECVHPVEPMAVPAGEAEMGESEAVSLFVDRARLARPDFTLRADDRPALVEICRDLDGIALAIELAAARTRVMSVGQIAARLNDRFRLLTGGSRTAARRQQTLEAAIDWSYDLLTADEQRAFRALAAYPAGISLLDAATVVGEAAADLLDQLVGKSVVQATGEDRYRMLATVRAYALAKLRADGEESEVRARQLAWAHAVAADDRRDRIDAEHANLLDLLAWTVDADPGGGADLALALHPYWNDRGDWTTGRGWLARLAGVGLPIGNTRRCRLLTKAADLAVNQGDVGPARAWVEESRALADAAGDVDAAMEPTMVLGSLAAMEGDADTARAHFERARQYAEAAGRPREAAGALVNLGNLAQATGDLPAAADWYDRAIAEAAAIGHDVLRAKALSHRGVVAGQMGDLDAARAHLGASTDLARGLGLHPQVAANLLYLGRLDQRAGELDRARAQVVEALDAHRRFGDRAGVVVTLATLSELACVLDDIGAAIAAADEAVALAADLDFPILVLNAHMVLGDARAAHGDWPAALTAYRVALDAAERTGNDAAVLAVAEAVAVAACAHGDVRMGAALLGAAGEGPSRDRAEAQARAGLGDREFDRLRRERAGDTPAALAALIRAGQPAR